jgi:uncharacterized protein YbjT (DUF2867 family)
MILVVGATGKLGGSVSQMLLAQGKSLRILARPQSNYKSLADAGAQVVMGDLKDRQSLDAACSGVETVITTANAAGRRGNDNPQTVDLEGNRKLIDAAKATGVKQFIFVSANVADPNSPDPFLQAKGKAEEYLRASGMPYTIIAANAFMEVWIAMVVGMPAMMGQPVTVVGEGHRKHSFISAGDVAAFIIATIGNPAAMNQRLLIGGPEPLSFRDAAAIYERVLARQIPVRSVAPGEPVPGLPDLVARMLASFDTFDSPIDMTRVADTFGIKPTPLEEVVCRSVTSTGSA